MTQYDIGLAPHITDLHNPNFNTKTQLKRLGIIKVIFYIIITQSELFQTSLKGSPDPAVLLVLIPCLSPTHARMHPQHQEDRSTCSWVVARKGNLHGGLDVGQYRHNQWLFNGEWPVCGEVHRAAMEA